MNEEKFNKSLSKFLEKETYIMVYRTNYDSAREFNNELINYIKQLQQENKQLKEEKEELKKYLEDDWSSVNGEIASKLILDKIKELEEGVKDE